MREKERIGDDDGMDGWMLYYESTLGKRPKAEQIANNEDDNNSVSCLRLLGRVQLLQAQKDQT